MSLSTSSWLFSLLIICAHEWHQIIFAMFMRGHLMIQVPAHKWLALIHKWIQLCFKFFPRIPHLYFMGWIGEELSCQREAENYTNPFAVVVMKDDNIVGSVSVFIISLLRRSDVVIHYFYHEMVIFANDEDIFEITILEISIHSIGNYCICLWPLLP